MRRHSGFSLAEVLVATLVLLVVVGAVFAMVSRASDVVTAQPEASDVQQRLRVGIATLQRDLLSAGAGGYAGHEPRALSRYLAPVLPYRWGEAPDGAFRNDVVTVVYVPAEPAQAAIASLQREPGEVVITMRMGEGAHTFEPGMRVMVFEPGGAWGFGAIAEAGGETLRVRTVAGLSPAFDAGLGVVAEVVTHTYSLKRDAGTAAFQLVHFDGVATELPVVDHVAALAFRYWIEEAGVPSLVEVAGASLTDGPWLPDAASPLRYDSDLLRIRRVSVRLRVHATSPWLRGAISRARSVPDAEATFDVSPPNMNLER